MNGMHQVLHLMGMVISFDVRDADADPECVAAAIDWLHLVDNTFSTFKADSEISRIDRGEMAVSESHPDVQYVLEQCAALAADSDGCFSAWRERDGVGHLDPAGYVKGWAVEQAAKIIESYGVSNFSINAGGDIALRGTRGAGQPWVVGIRHPDHIEQIVAVLDITGPYAVATSGTYERGAHIQDPRTGKPSTALTGMTVVGPELALADAYATAAFVMGVEGLTWVHHHKGYGALATLASGQGISTPLFQALRRPQQAASGAKAPSGA